MRTVIIVCDRAAERCPTTWPWVGEKLVWPFPDPAAAAGSEEASLNAFRDTCSLIEARLRAWLAGATRIGEEPAEDIPT